MSFTVRSAARAAKILPGADEARESIGGMIVDWSGTRPTEAEVRAAHSPSPADLAAAAKAIADKKLAEPVDDTDPIWAAIKELREQIKLKKDK